MTDERRLTTAAYLYLYTVITIGFLVIAHSVGTLALHPISRQWLVLAALTLLTGSFSVKVPSVSARISVSDAFVFASVLLFGPAPTTVVVALDSFVMSMWLKPHRRIRLRSLFNCAAVALAIWVAASSFFWLTHASPGRLDELLPLENHLWALFALAALYFLLNSCLVALALAFERRTKPLQLWWRTFPPFSLSYFGGVSAAALLVSYTRTVDLSTISIILPFLLISYLTYRTSLGRIEDSKRHVEQIHELYMSTIEALAMAVDAKDQITHGHIRRVQVYAVELARRLGVRDDKELKAIEAAALLHDMGKLAIPEHILNKPGSLTAGEFETMKRHADIGADLLSSVRFPYPVVPIVRHHHESWNGHGYPTGISGTDIPLGARILSVVDCFDALTSDRPYRRALSSEEAFAILSERRGSMYDPLVVDTFRNVFDEIAPAALLAGQKAKSLVDIALSEHSECPAGAAETVTASTSDAEAQVRFRFDSEATARAATILRELVPLTLYALFRYDRQRDVLICETAQGEGAQLLLGLTIRVGERVVGWAAATHRAVLNADPTLDLIELAERQPRRLQSALVAPIVAKQELLGVVAVYSERSIAYLPADSVVIEAVAASLGRASRQPDNTSTSTTSSLPRGALQGLQHASHV